jgi:hypothetical protein
LKPDFNRLSEAEHIMGRAKTRQRVREEEPALIEEIEVNPEEIELADFLDGLGPQGISEVSLYRVLPSGKQRFITGGPPSQFSEQYVQVQFGEGVYAFRGDEYGVLNGRFHIHALLGNVGNFPAYCGKSLAARNSGEKPRPCCGVHSWPGGYARVFPYDPAISATGYVSKYVTKDFGDYELIGHFIPAAVYQLNLIQ